MTPSPSTWTCLICGKECFERVHFEIKDEDWLPGMLSFLAHPDCVNKMPYHEVKHRVLTHRYEHDRRLQQIKKEIEGVRPDRRPD